MLQVLKTRRRPCSTGCYKCCPCRKGLRVLSPTACLHGSPAAEPAVSPRGGTCGGGSRVAGGRGALGCPSELHKSSALPGCAGRLLLPQQKGRNQANVRRERSVEEVDSLAVVPGGVEAGGTAWCPCGQWCVAVLQVAGTFHSCNIAWFVQATGSNRCARLVPMYSSPL